MDSVYCNINPDTRVIDIPDEIQPFGVESDENANTVYFKMENSCNELLTTPDTIKDYEIGINYSNANSEIDRSIIIDAVIDVNNVLTFSWPLPEKALLYHGKLHFVVCILKRDDTKEIIWEWNSALANAQVLEGLETEIILNDDSKDILEQLLNAVIIRKNQAVSEISNLVTTESTAIDQKVTSATEEISDMVADIPNTVQQLTPAAIDQYVSQASGDLFASGKEVLYNIINTALRTTTQNGIICTNNGDGTYTIQQGTASGNAFFPLIHNPTFLGTMKMCGCPAGGSGTTYAFIYSNNTDGSKADLGNGVTTAQYNASTYPSCDMGIWIKSGAIISTPLIFKPMLTRNLAAVYNDYVPYNGGMSVGYASGVSYREMLKTQARSSLLEKATLVNHLKPTLQTITQNGIICTNNGDGTYTINGQNTSQNTIYLTVGSITGLKTGTQYSFISSPDGGSGDTFFSYVQYSPSNILWSSYNKSASIKAATSSDSVSVMIAIRPGISMTNAVFKPMITTDLSATYDDFVPYTGPEDHLNENVAAHETSIEYLHKNAVANILKPTLQTTVSNGITCTNNGDGTYTLQPGTATGDIAFRLFASTTAPNKYKGMKLVGCPNIHNSHYNIFVNYCTDAAWEGVAQEFGDGLILSSDTKYTRIVFSIIVSSGEVISTPLVFKPMITTDLSATYDDFVPYTGPEDRLNENVAAHEMSIEYLHKNATANMTKITSGNNIVLASIKANTNYTLFFEQDIDTGFGLVKNTAGRGGLDYVNIVSTSTKAIATFSNTSDCNVFFNGWTSKNQRNFVIVEGIYTNWMDFVPYTGTSGLLNKDVADIRADLDTTKTNLAQLLVVENKATTSNVTVTANGYVKTSIPVSKTGYTPIGIVGVSSQVNCPPIAFQISTDKQYAEVFPRNVTGSAISTPINVTVLYMKNIS